MSCAGTSDCTLRLLRRYRAWRRRRARATCPVCRRSRIAPAPGRRSRSRCWRGCRAPTIRRWPRLKTRDDDDFSIALLDAGCGDARHPDLLPGAAGQRELPAHGYATPARLLELSRLIGYQPAPGVGRSSYLAFTLSAAPGSADRSDDPGRSPFRRARRCRACRRRARRRRPSRHRPTSWPKPTGTRWRCKPAFPGCRSPAI